MGKNKPIKIETEFLNIYELESAIKAGESIEVTQEFLEQINYQYEVYDVKPSWVVENCGLKLLLTNRV